MGSNRVKTRRLGLAAALMAVLALSLTACFPPAEPGAPILMKGTWAGGLSTPWDLAFLPTGVGIYTENDLGLISARMSDTETHRVLGDVHTFDAGFDPTGEGGLMGIAIDPNWSVNQRAYVCYSTSTGGIPGGENRVARFTLNPAASPAISGWTPIVTGIPHYSFHNGCRVRFQPGTGALFVSTGDAGSATAPQDDNSLGGKILRIDTNGAAWPGNLSGQRWYTKGHRNPQGIEFRPGTLDVFDNEHGPDTNDEVNKLVNGGNAGWNPNVGGFYNQTVPMTDTSLGTPASPIITATWSSGTPTVAPSGGTFLSGAKWRTWDGALVLPCLKAEATIGQRLLVMHLSPDGRSLTNPPVSALALGVRLRAAVQGPDGNLYVVTDGANGAGAIWLVTPS